MKSLSLLILPLLTSEAISAHHDLIAKALVASSFSFFCFYPAASFSNSLIQKSSSEVPKIAGYTLGAFNVIMIYGCARACLYPESFKGKMKKSMFAALIVGGLSWLRVSPVNFLRGLIENESRDSAQLLGYAGMAATSLLVFKAIEKFSEKKEGKGCKKALSILCQKLMNC
jgi:hypothetical protein